MNGFKVGGEIDIYIAKVSGWSQNKVTNIRLVSKKGLNNDMTCPAKRRRKYVYVFMIFSCHILKIFSYYDLHIDHL